MTFFLKNLSQSFLRQYVSSRPIFSKASSVFPSIAGPVLLTKKRKLFTVGGALEKTNLFPNLQKKLNSKQYGIKNKSTFTVAYETIAIPSAKYQIKYKTNGNQFFKNDYRYMNTDCKDDVNVTKVKKRSKIKKLTPTQRVQQIAKSLNGTWISQKYNKVDSIGENYNFRLCDDQTAPIKIDNEYKPVYTSFSDQPAVTPSIRKFSKQASSDDENKYTNTKQKNKHKNTRTNCSKLRKTKKVENNDISNRNESKFEEVLDTKALAKCLKKCLTKNKTKTSKNKKSKNQPEIHEKELENKSDKCKPCSSKQKISANVKPKSDNSQQELIKRIENLEREFYEIKKTTSHLSQKTQPCIESPRLDKKLPITQEDQGLISRNKTLKNKNRFTKNRSKAQKANEISPNVKDRCHTNSEQENVNKSNLDSKLKENETSLEDVSCGETKKYRLQPPCNLDEKKSEIEEQYTKKTNDKICECNKQSEHKNPSEQTKCTSPGQTPIMQCIALCHKKKQANIPQKGKGVPPRDKKPCTQDPKIIKKLADFKEIKKNAFTSRAEEYVPCKNEKITSPLKATNNTEINTIVKKDQKEEKLSDCKKNIFDIGSDNNNKSDSCVCHGNEINDKKNKSEDGSKKEDKCKN